MKEESKSLIEKIHPEFTCIERLIEQKKSKEALAELRDFEQTHKFDPNSTEFGSFCYLSAVVLHYLGNYENALSKGKEAFEILRHTPQDKQIAKLQFLLGLIYIELGESRKARSELRDALAIYRRIDDKTGVISVLNRLARISFMNSDYEKAIEYLYDCIDSCDEIGEEAGKTFALGNLGTIYMLTGKWQLATECLELSIKSNKQRNDVKNLCNGLISLAYVHYLRRDFEKATRYCNEALNIAESNSYLLEYAICHEYLGEFSSVQGDYLSAKQHYLKAIEIGEKITPNGWITSQTYRLLAELQIAEGQYDEALYSCEKASKVAKNLGERIEIGAIHRALGQIYTARKQKEKATENFEKSIYISEQIGAKFELGKAYLEAGKSACFDFFDRVHYLRRAKDVFKELDSQYHQGLVLFSLSKLFFDNGEYEKALLFLEDAEKIFSAIGRSASGGKELKEERELSSVLSFRKILEKTLGKAEKATDPKKRYTFSNIITQNHQMQEIIQEAKEIKDSNLTILLEGETGTGKDLLAKIIHYESKRKDKNFVVAQCSAIPESLLENALFGHVKGAYTGANENSVGLFQEAEGGTLYLDEIAEIPLTTQVKLLRVIEEKEITRIGETKPKKIDVRIIASTSRDLQERVSKGLFRLDLYFRLNALSFKLPPLRERKGDIPLLIVSFLNEDGLSDDVSKILDDPEFNERILEHDWPGNVRELRHEIEKLGALAVVNHRGNSDFFKERMNHLSNNKERLSLCDEVAEFEKKKIVEALKQSGGIKLKAAKMLGIPETTLRNKMKRHKIE
jgi:DNA-binding NtrC family response regulator/Tfp pilus assembly protein PilF